MQFAVYVIYDRNFLIYFEVLVAAFPFKILVELFPPFLQEVSCSGVYVVFVPLVVALGATAFEIPIAVEGMSIGVVGGDVVYAKEYFRGAAAAVAAGKLIAFENFQFLLRGDRCLVHIVLSVLLKVFGIYE